MHPVNERLDLGPDRLSGGVGKLFALFEPLFYGGVAQDVSLVKKVNDVLGDVDKSRVLATKFFDGVQAVQLARLRLAVCLQEMSKLKLKNNEG